MRGFLYILLLTALLPSAYGNDADLLRIEVTGAAPGDGPPAHRAAWENAHREAVEQVLRSLIFSDNLAPVAPILANAPRYIHSLRETKRRTTENGVEIDAEAYVVYPAIRQDAAKLLFGAFLTPPKAVILIEERFADAACAPLDEPGAGEAVMVGLLQTVGVEVVPPEAARRFHTESELRAVLNGDRLGAGKFGRAHLADVAVLGSIEQEVDGAASQQAVVANRATVTLRVVRSSDNALIDTWSAEQLVHSADTAVGMELAIRDAATKLRDKVMDAIALAVAGAPPSTDVVLTVEHASNRSRFDEVAGRVSAYDAVKETEMLAYSEQLGRLRIEYAGGMRALTDWLTSSTYTDFTLEINHVVGRSITANVKPHPRPRTAGP